MGEENATTPAWGKPIPFETVNVPDFPIESLPGPIFAYVEALAEFTQTPVEMVAVLSLGVLATAFQSKYEVEQRRGYVEPLCLYTLAVAAPGERKSSVHSAITRPIYEYEKKRRDAEAAEVEYSKAEMEVLKKTFDVAKDKAAKSKNAQERENAEYDMRSLSEKLTDFKEKHHFRLLADDTTPEKLVDIMDAHGGCITVSSAEGGVFDAIAISRDKKINLDVYLKGHAGDIIQVDRIGRKQNSIMNPRLTMMLTVQPDVLNGFLSNKELKGRGLCGRFLYVICKSKVGHRKVNTESVPPDIENDYKQFIKMILDDPNGGTIHLSDEAQAIYIAHSEAVEKRLIGDWEHMADWANKFTGAILRIAALIHAAEVQGNPAETPISSEVMEAAIKIGECLGVHAMAAYQAMGADETVEAARYLWRKIQGADKWEVSKRDVFDACKGKFKKMDNMEPAVKQLIEMNYIQEWQKNTGGRPTTMLSVNPNARQE